MNWLQRIAQNGWYGTQKGYWLALWVDTEGNIYDVEDTHHAWVNSHRKILLEKYGIDIEQIEEEAYYVNIQDAFEYLEKDLISDHAFSLGIDESQVVLTEEEKEGLNDQSSNDADHQLSGTELVDLLIKQGWLRVAKKTAIHIEGDEGSPRFFDRAEMVLIERFPDVWRDSQHEIGIVINNTEIYAGDLQHAGSLESAIRKSERKTNHYMDRR